MKLKPEVKEKWLAALRSGEYKQGREALKQRDQFSPSPPVINLQSNKEIYLYEFC